MDHEHAASIPVGIETLALLLDRRKGTETFNETILRLLKASEPADEPDRYGEQPLIRGNTTFPAGTKLRAEYKGEFYFGVIRNGRISVDGYDETTSSFSRAARMITDNSVNGWRFWYVQFPGGTKWTRAENLKEDE
ncbi:MAG: hypothetical protein AB7O88_23630 [Reyranellaceae bacterium]